MQQARFAELQFQYANIGMYKMKQVNVFMLKNRNAREKNNSIRIYCSSVHVEVEIVQ